MVKSKHIISLAKGGLKMSDKQEGQSLKKREVKKLRFTYLTQKEFEALLTKAAQPLQKPEQPPDREAKQTSEQPTSGDCSESHTH